MAQEFLLRFLEIGAIDLKGEDTRLGKLRSTAKDLATILRKAPSKTACFTMAAADPNIAATDPTIVEAMASLRRQWETVANAFSGVPVGLLRPVLLDAIVQAARADDAIAVAFVNTARNALAYAEASKEAEIWHEAVSEIETKVDARAVAEWATPEMIEVGSLQYTPPPLLGKVSKAPGPDLEALQQSTAEALKHVGHGQYSQQWVPTVLNEFSDGLSQVLTDLATKLAPTPVDISSPLAILAKEVASHVDKALASFSGATAGLQRRTNLLWWKEALYSPSAHTSYLDLSPFEASALMALDLHEQVPTYSPASVSAFLREAIRCLPAASDASSGQRDVASLVHSARTTAFMQPFRTLAAQYAPAPTGRGPILALIGHPQDLGTIDPTTLRALCGLDASSTMTPAEWGTLLFRELQTARATSDSSTKRAKKK